MKAYVFALVFTVFSVRAEVSVTGVKVQPRSPWNGMVDVEYTVACDDLAADVYINPVVYDGDRRITMFPSSFTGEGWESPVKAGKHKLVWDARKDFGAYSCANFQFKIYAGTRLAKYVKIDLSSGSESDNYPVTLSSVGPDVTKDDCRTTELWLRLVPPGEFWMGSPNNEVGRSDNEDLHHVTLTKPFYIGVFEMTQKQWELVMGSKPSYFSTSTNWAVRPVEQISYHAVRGSFSPGANTGFDGNSFVSKLRARTHTAVFDLPSETRWEYACRAGSTSAFHNDANLINQTTSADAAQIASYYGNSFNDQPYNQTTVGVGSQKVGSFLPNRIGIYDMSGNVLEYCRDGFGHSHRWGNEDIQDPEPYGDINDGYYSAIEYTYYYVLRGGGWGSPAKDVRSAARFSVGVYYYYSRGSSSHYIDKTRGFRICAEAEF